MAQQQRKKRARRRMIEEREPEREKRPSIEELGGISEYQVQSATSLEQNEVGDPMTDVARAPAKKGGPPIEEPLSVPPDELGASFLRRAVQDPRPTEPDEELPHSETDEISPGERRMLERRLGATERAGPLITALLRRSEEEGELSELTEQAGKEVRTPQRAERIRNQSRRVAELRSDRKRAVRGPRRKRGHSDAKR